MKEYSRRLPVAILLVLVVQFVLGILSTAYQEIPEGAAKYDVYSHFGLIFLHVIVGTTLLALVIVFGAGFPKRAHTPTMGKVAIGAVVAVSIAFTAGTLFVETGNDVFSIIMGSSFLGALIAMAYLSFCPVPEVTEAAKQA